MDGLPGMPGDVGPRGEPGVPPEIKIRPDGCMRCPEGQRGPPGYPGEIGDPVRVSIEVS